MVCTTNSSKNENSGEHILGSVNQKNFFDYFVSNFDKDVSPMNISLDQLELPYTRADRIISVQVHDSVYDSIKVIVEN